MFPGDRERDRYGLILRNAFMPELPDFRADKILSSLGKPIMFPNAFVMLS
jgi:hypothetical protein